MAAKNFRGLGLIGKIQPPQLNLKENLAENYKMRRNPLYFRDSLVLIF